MSVKIPTPQEETLVEQQSARINPALAWTLVGVFLATIYLFPVAQHFKEIKPQMQAAAEGSAPVSPRYSLPQCYQIVNLLPQFQEILAVRGVRDILGLLPTLKELDDYEDALEENSVVANWILPKAQFVLTGALGVGNEQAYLGKDGWLHYRPEFDYLTEGGFLDESRLRQKIRSGSEESDIVQPDPIKAIVHFNRQLAKRGIDLVVMPTPGKLMIHPEKLTARAAGIDNPLQNQSYGKFVQALQREGITVFDCSQSLVDAKLKSGRAMYLVTDTHWTPEAMELTAQELSELLKAKISQSNPLGYTRQAKDVDNLGDIAMMLKLPNEQHLFKKQNVRINQIKMSDGTAWNPSKSSEILLLGDSFTNIYSMKGLGWGEAAGFAEQLSFYLQQPVDKIAMNAGGAYSARQQLQRDLARGNDRLDGKKVVVYQFAARELAHGDWKLLDLPIVKPKLVSKPKSTEIDEKLSEEDLSQPDVESAESQSDKPEEPAESSIDIKDKPTVQPVPVVEDKEKAVEEKAGLIVRGILKEKTEPPKPGTVPYKDCVIALHLSGVTATRGQIGEREVIVFVWGMRDNRWTDLASLVPGRSITLKLTSWDDVEAKYGSYNRIELDSDEAFLLDIYWGE